MASNNKRGRAGSEKGDGENTPRYRVDEKEIGEVFNSAALRMAKEVASSLNNIMNIPGVDYRAHKKVPKDKLEKVLEYLIMVATTEDTQATPIEDPNVVIQDAYKDDMNKMIIERRGVGQIQEMLFQKHQADVKKSTISAYITKFKKTSEFMKAAKDWVEDIDDMRLYHMRGRLSELEELYIDSYRRWKNSPTKANADMCLKILEQARREAMPVMNQITVNNNNIQQNIITNILAKEEQMAVFDRLPLHEIIIGKVAAKYRRDPYLLQRRLQNSYYAAQAGAQGMDKLGEPIEYPTAILYNVEDLGAKWKEIQAEEAKVVREANIDEKINESPDEIKEALLKRVAERLKKKEGGAGDTDGEDK